MVWGTSTMEEEWRGGRDRAARSCEGNHKPTWAKTIHYLCQCLRWACHQLSSVLRRLSMMNNVELGPQTLPCPGSVQLDLTWMNGPSTDSSGHLHLDSRMELSELIAAEGPRLGSRQASPAKKNEPKQALLLMLSLGRQFHSLPWLYFSTLNKGCVESLRSKANAVYVHDWYILLPFLYQHQH